MISSLPDELMYRPAPPNTITIIQVGNRRRPNKKLKQRCLIVQAHIPMQLTIMVPKAKMRRPFKIHYRADEKSMLALRSSTSLTLSINSLSFSFTAK